MTSDKKLKGNKGVGKAYPSIISPNDTGVTTLNDLMGAVDIVSPKETIDVKTGGQQIQIDSSQVSANKADIAKKYC